MRVTQTLWLKCNVTECCCLYETGIKCVHCLAASSALLMVMQQFQYFVAMCMHVHEQEQDIYQNYTHTEVLDWSILLIDLFLKHTKCMK